LRGQVQRRSTTARRGAHPVPPSFTTFREETTTNGAESARPPVSQPNLNGRPLRTGHRYALRNWRVRTRLVALILVPTLAAVALAGLRVASSLRTSDAYAKTYELAQVDERVVDLILGLQDERDEMGRFIVNGRQADDRALVEGRQATTDGLALAYRDQVSNFNGTFESDEVSAKLGRIEARLSRLKEIRAAGLDSEIDAAAATNAYTSIIEELLDFNGEIGQDSKDEEITQSVRALDALARTEEFAARQRGLIFRAISDGAFAPGELTELGDEQARRDGSLADFQRNASPAQISLYNSLLSGSDAEDTAALKQKVEAEASSGNNLREIKDEDGTTLNADVWFQTAKRELDLLRAVERRVIQDLNNRSQELQDNAQRGALLDTLVVALVLFLAFLGISIIGRSMTRPLRRLRGSAFEVAETRLPEIVRRLEEGDGRTSDVSIELVPVASTDEIGEVARAFDAVHAQAVRLAVEQAELRSNVNAMFVNLSRRSQGLVERQLRLIENLENSEPDPDQLGNLFRLDHLATRMRRNGENLLVLAGEEPERRWSQPVPLVDVIRAALSEVEQYERIELTALPDLEIAGRAVNDVVHLLAEVLENATAFSSGDTRVNVASHVLGSGGVMIEVEDAGIGIEPAELEQINERLTNPPVIDVSVSRRMGLFVVGRLAYRHGIRARLRAGANGGIAALVALPPDLVSFTSGAVPVGAGAGLIPAPQTPATAAAARPLTGPAAGLGTNPFGLPLGPRPELPAGEVPAAQNGAGVPDAGPDGRPGAPLNVPLGPPPSVPGPPLVGTVLPPIGRDGAPAPKAPGSGPIPQVPGSGQMPPPAGSGPIPRVPVPQVPGSGPMPPPPGGGPIPPGPATARAFPSEPSEPDAGTKAGQETPASAATETGRPPFPLPAGPDVGDGEAGAPAALRQGIPGLPPLPESPSRQLPPLTAADLVRASGGNLSSGDILDPSAPGSRGDRNAEPIFVSIQSEWFRRRTRPAATARPTPPDAPATGAPATGAPTTGATPVPSAAAAAETTAAPRVPAQPAAGLPSEESVPAPEPATVAAQTTGAADRPQQQPQVEVEEEDEVWTSPADSGFEAAAVVASPSVGGYTAAGLPRRIPKTNLVPGTVGGSSAGQGRHAQRSADEVRGRLSSFHLGTRRGRDQGPGEEMPEDAGSMAASEAEPGGHAPTGDADEQENE
jgi:signal transduction histidine kinase